ncbi:oxidoreductase HTATIP2-like [Mercenaria mercenaria]|uniref:oxidoreductase HTATIP2-like n=1 Tax=Mercenaria mercenaria TaxID=6596 RepID=UPI001E1E053F|nr:oxidoreductase HTATIP2-like [Mercenaria mercenaria]
MLWFKCDEIIPGVAIAVAFIAVCLGGFFLSHEYSPILNVDTLCSMAEAAEDQREMFRQASKTAVVLGHTGETGRVLVKQLAQEKLFKKVTLIGRREIALDRNVVGPEFEQKVIDFEKLDDYTEEFKGHDVGFWCLGTTRGKVGVEGFKRVDYDYVLKTAELAKSGGMQHMQFMSTYGANANSSALYTRTKGQVEEALKVMHFQRLSIFRPGVLMVDRQESRPMEAFARLVLTPVSKIFPTAITIPVDYVAAAMINNAVATSDKTSETFENKEMHILSGKSPLCKKDEKTKTK